MKKTNQPDFYFEHFNDVIRRSDIGKDTMIAFGDNQGTIHLASAKITSVEKMLWYSSHGVSINITHINGIPLFIEDCTFKEYLSYYHDILMGEKTMIISNIDIRRYCNKWKKCNVPYQLQTLSS